MAFVVVGVLLVVAKILDLWPVLYWSWPVVLAPFGLAVIWWAISDHLGITQARIRREELARREERRRRALSALGLQDHDNKKRRR